MREYTGWHFTASATEGRDGWPLQAVERLPKGTKPELCEAGLHASRRALDALRYAPGPFVSRVRLSGVVVVGDDKACGTVRTRLAGPVDVSRELRLFAADCAERVLPIFERERPGDLRPREAIETARRDVTGDATDEELDAAWDAAWAAGAAAGAAARGAAWAAAGAAAWDAAGAAVWAARDAAWDAAWAAAWAAARDAAWDAGDAARDAAGDAECRWQEAELTRALLAALEEGGMNRELRETPAGTACRACGGTENIESHWCSAWLAPGGDPVLAVDHWEHWHKDCGCEFAALEQGE